MTTMPTTARLAAAFALLLTLLVTGQPAAAQRQPDESILTEFQVFTCPVGYAGDDYLADCAPAGAGDYAITVTDASPTEPTATTETAADGAIQFATFPGATSYDLAGADDAATYYACFDGTETFLFDGTGQRIETTLADGDALSCRWYVTPSTDGASAAPSAPADGTGSLALQVFECPVAYAGDDYLADCTPGSDADDANLAGEGGGQERFYTADLDDSFTAQFTDIPANRYGVGSGTSVSYPGGEVYLACFDVSSGSERFLFDGLTSVEAPADDPWEISITIEAGGQYACRYYETPGDPALAGPVPGSADDPADSTVGVQVFDCPDGYDQSDFAADCQPTDRPVGVTLNDGYRFDQSTVIRDQAGDDGQSGFVDLYGGQYYLEVEDLSETTTTYWTCFDVTDGVEDFDRDGFHNRVRFSLGASVDYSCRIYLTPNGPEPPAPGTPGTVTVYVLSCPESYRGPDWTAECTDPVDSNSVGISGSPTQPGTYALDIVDGVATFRNVEPGPVGAGTDIPGHSTEQRGACVVGAGPIDDALIDDDPSDDGVTIGEGEGATCVIYITGISLRG